MNTKVCVAATAMFDENGRIEQKEENIKKRLARRAIKYRMFNEED